jgi:hypothetical protein
LKELCSETFEPLIHDVFPFLFLSFQHCPYEISSFSVNGLGILKDPRVLKRDRRLVGYYGEQLQVVLCESAIFALIDSDQKANRVMSLNAHN